MYEVMVLTGIALLVAGSLLLLVGAFRERILWGLACLLLPPAALVFTVLHWDVAKKPFFIQLFGFGIVLLAPVLAQA